MSFVSKLFKIFPLLLLMVFIIIVQLNKKDEIIDNGSIISIDKYNQQFEKQTILDNNLFRRRHLGLCQHFLLVVEVYNVSTFSAHCLYRSFGYFVERYHKSCGISHQFHNKFGELRILYATSIFFCIV